MFRVFSSGLVRCSLQSVWRRAALLLAVGLAGAIISGEALRVAIAAMLGQSLDLDRVEAALTLDPANPGLHRRLGQFYMFVMEDLNAAQGMKHFRRATELNPNQSAAWADLGSACDLIRDTACADRAFEQALRLNPMSPDLTWVAANHYLLTGRSDPALAHFRRLLQLSPRYAQQTFALSLRVLNDPQLIFQRVMAGAEQDPKLILAFIGYLSTHGKLDDAYQVWSQTIARSSPFGFPLVKPYLDGLIEARRYGEATNIWQDLERLRVIKQPRAEDARNLVYNGDFEQDPLDSGLDWHVKKEPYLEVDFTDPAAYRGARCLRLDFTVSRNGEYEPVYQIVPVAPDQTYVLSAYIRSEDITSDSGPCLRILDPICSECLNLSGPMTLGTTGWHRADLKFTTGAQTRVVRLSVWRPRSRTFPAEISGRFWIDRVYLETLNSPGDSSALATIP